MKKYLNKTVLCISDLHCPYQHPDTIAFLTAIKKKYQPDRVVCLGDEVDAHAISYHESDPDLASAGHELDQAIKALQPIYNLFPKVDIIDSNHGSLAFRKAKTAGLPKKYLREYRDILDAPDGWKWHDSLMITLSDGQQCFFHHGLKANPVQVSREYSVNVVQGHFHSTATIAYASTPYKLLWGMNVGCSIDTHSLAFAYNKTTLARPIISHGIIVDGQPRLLPMILTKASRWCGKVP